MRRQPLIIGAGPAGCAAAITLARAGHSPILIDRTTEPTDKVCGDFLGADTIARARALGCDPAALGAVPVRRVRLIHGRREIEATLPFEALSLSRRTLDNALRQAAERAGAIVHGGKTVRRLSRDGNGWVIDIGVDLTATAVFLATGKHDLRDHPRPRYAGSAVGLKQYLYLPDLVRHLLGDATELTLFPGGYAGLQHVEAGRTALCIAVRRDAFQTHGGTWDRLLDVIARASPRFAAVMADARPILPKPLAVAGVPYGFLHPPCDDGLFRIGDQAAVIPSLTGDGLAIALHSGHCAAKTWASGGDARTYHTALRNALRGQMRLAGALHAAFLSPFCQPWVLRAAALPLLIRQVALLTRVGSG
jgi:flavin-dependent dehydrogenase